MRAILLFLVAQVWSYSLSTRSQFHIFSTFFNYYSEVENYVVDDAHIAFISKQRIMNVVSLAEFNVKAQFDLRQINFTARGSPHADRFNLTLDYPRGILSRNSFFFMFEINDNSHNHRMFSFVDQTIDSITLLDKGRALVLAAKNNETELAEYSSFFELSNPENRSLLMRRRIAGSPIELLSLRKKKGEGSGYIDISDGDWRLNSNFETNISNETDDDGFLYLYLPLRSKLKRIANYSLLDPIIQTIERAYNRCLTEPDFTVADLDFELDSDYFLISCQEQLFVFSLESLLTPNQTNNLLSNNQTYYRNSVERLFLSRAALKILHSDQRQLIYSIFCPETVCFYLFERYKEDFNYFMNRRSLCMRNSVTFSSIEDIFLNQQTGYVNLVLRNETDDTVFFPGFHRCVLNMKSNFVCQICNTYFCPKQCERFQYPGCNFIGNVQRTFFGVLTVMVLFSIVFLFCAHVCKNRETVCEVYLNFFRCLWLLISQIFGVFRRIDVRNAIRNGVRRVKILWSYAKYWLRCGFWRRLTEEGNNCPICLEHIENRPKTKFACGRHEAHTDCFQHYTANNRENGKVEGCPFRDA